MDTKPVTIKATLQALQHLRLIAAYTGERQYVILERLLQAELARVAAASGHTFSK